MDDSNEIKSGEGEGKVQINTPYPEGPNVPEAYLLPEPLCGGWNIWDLDNRREHFVDLLKRETNQ